MASTGRIFYMAGGKHAFHTRQAASQWAKRRQPDPEKRMVAACYDPRCQPKLDWRREAGVCICEPASRRQLF